MSDMRCPACKDIGGFNVFRTSPGEGTTYTLEHSWIPCTLCKAWAQTLAQVSQLEARLAELETALKEANKPKRKHRATKDVKQESPEVAT